MSDVDGDGRLELVYTRSNADGEAQASSNVSMIARDLLTGEIRHERARSRLVGRHPQPVHHPRTPAAACDHDKESHNLLLTQVVE